MTTLQRSLAKQDVAVASIPRSVGFWLLQYADEVPYTCFPVYAKPTDEQIKNTEALLGWKWKDA